jgi:outer membrane receptor protein involved in Fe transport
MSKKQSGQRKSLLTGASVLAAAAAAMAGSPAMAQNNTSTASSSDDEAIVVTGTRLVRQDFEAISPVTTVGAEQIQLTGTLNTEQLLNDLPQVVGGNTTTSNNTGGEDFSTVDLRGLGPNRTLVLVNGERVPASSTTGVVDINTIPAGLISRVEVVSGGASAVYGSDAMGGVVNFVLKDDYEGAELNATYGSELSTGNVPQFDANLLVGGNFANGRGNMTFYADYYNRQGVFQSEYDYSRVSGAACRRPDGTVFLCDSAAEAVGNTVLFPGGSGTPPWSWIVNSPATDTDHDGVRDTGTGNPFGNPTYSCNSAADLLDDSICNDSEGDGTPGSGDGVTDTPVYASGLATTLPGHFATGNTNTNCDGIPDGNVNTGNLSFDDAGNLVPRAVAGACGVPDRGAGSSRYNYAPDNYLIIPAERFTVSTNGHYDINDNLRFNFLMSYTNSRQQVQLAATPVAPPPQLEVTMTPTMRNLISTAHPDLWTALQGRPDPYAPFQINVRTNSIGPRTGTNTDNQFYAIGSLDGQLGDNWDWNLSASYGQSEFLSRLQHSANKTGLFEGLSGCTSLQPGPNGILGDADDTETPMGSSALPGCVPLDIFGTQTLPADAVSFLNTPTFSSTIVEESRVSGYMRGNLFQLPAGPVSTVFGFEYRDTSAQFFVDNEQRTGNIFGFNAVQNNEGQIDVYELYTEFAIPLISEQPFAYYLGLEGGYRISNYSQAGNVETWKAGGEWAPTSWLRFRGVYNVATRAPSVFELFRNGDQGFTGYTDPCQDAAENNGAGDGVPDGQTAGTTPIPAANCTAGAGGRPIVNGWGTGFVQNNAQTQVLAFGNTNLAPETADTYTIGGVFQPDWFPVGDLRVTVDYYHIQIDGFIAGFSANQILADCYGVPGAVAVPGSCSKITRNAVTGQVDSIDVSVQNLSTLVQSGYDIQAEWSLPLGPGQLTINELYSRLNEFVINGVDFAGYGFGGIGGGPFGGVAPEQKSVLSVTYALGDWTFLTRWTWAPGFTDASFGGETPDSSYVDVSARWNVTDNFSVIGVVDNVFDDYPPQYAGAAVNGQANTNPVYYRALGRTFTISGRLRF